jgi:hypothetical protein
LEREELESGREAMNESWPVMHPALEMSQISADLFQFAIEVLDDGGWECLIRKLFPVDADTRGDS